MEPYIIRAGNIIYFLNKDFTVSYSSEWNNGVLVGYKDYYQGAKYDESIQKFEKNIIAVNKKREVLSATEMKQNSPRIISVKEYPAGTKYGVHSGKEHVSYYMNQFNEIGHMEKKTAGKLDYIATYHEGAKYPANSQNYIKYAIYFNPNGTVKYSREQEKETKTIKKYIEYEPNTKYGDHVNKETARHYISNNNRLGISEIMKNKVVVSYIIYYPNSIYGVDSKRNKKYVFHVDRNKILTHSEEYSEKTGKMVRIYYFESGTKYGENHNKKVVKVVNIT
jgi:hypothetical protein